MQIKDLQFGSVEGKDEFDLSKNNSNEKIENTFYVDDRINYDDFLNGNKSYIYGHKGTGKTSLLKYIEYKAKVIHENKTISILFKDIKNDIQIYSIFLKLLGSVKDQNSSAKVFWQWFILSVIVEENNIETNEENLIFYTNNTLFNKLSNILTRIINVKYKYKNDKHELELGANLSELNIDESNDLYTASIKIDILKKLINKKLNKKLYIFIDELEISKLSENYLNDSILIKNLIIMVEVLNEISENLFINLAVRTEVLNNIFTAGDEINKLLESKGECIQWEYDKYSISHPLIKIVIKKIRYSMNTYSNGDMAIKAKRFSDEEIFNYWFESELVDSSNNPIQILLNNTWLKPRDIIRLMCIMKKEAFYCNKFNKSFFKKSIKKYSDASWIELQEELVTILDQNTIKYINKTFANYKPDFSFVELRARIIRKSNYDHPKVEHIIDTLYDIGIIGNRCFDDDDNIIKYKYSFRGDKYLDKNKNIEIHRGLMDHFSISKKRKLQHNNDINSNNNSDVLLELLHELK